MALGSTAARQHQAVACGPAVSPGDPRCVCVGCSGAPLQGCADVCPSPRSTTGGVCISGGSLSGSLSTVASTTSSPYVCEIDLTCNSGWSLYTDNGSEGKNSCLKMGSYATDWNAAKNSCDRGAHLVTIGGSVTSSGLPAAISTLISGAHVYIGCSGSASNELSSWAWVDGTPTTRLNCGATGCGLWTTSQPRCVGVVCACSCVPPVSGVCVCVSL